MIGVVAPCSTAAESVHYARDASVAPASARVFRKVRRSTDGRFASLVG